MRLIPSILVVLLPLASLASGGSRSDGMNPPAAPRFEVTQSTSSEIIVECSFPDEFVRGALSDNESPVAVRWIRLPDAGEAVVANVERIGTTGLDRLQMATVNSQNAQQPVTLGEIISQRGVRLQAITFSPFMSDNSSDVTWCEQVAATVRLPESDGKRRALRSGQREMWGDLILNRDDPERDQIEETAEGIYVYVIPDNANVRNAIDPLIQWRRQQGYNTRELTLPQWGDASWIYEQLLNIDTPDSPIDYILLAGDFGGAFSVPSLARGIPSDYYFTFLDGDDRYPDAAVGRLSYNSIPELQRMVAKILNYEQRFEPPGAWLSRAGVAAGSAQSGYSTILVSRWLRQFFLSHGYDRVDTLWYTMEGSVSDYMRDTFERGVHFVTYRGWTGLEDWTPEAAGGLRNRVLPVAVLLACNSGDYFGQGAGFTEALLRANGGAIGAIGVAGSQSRINFNNVMMASYFDGILNEGAYRLGWTLNRARVGLMMHYGDLERELPYDHACWTNLMGDPATSIWHDEPENIQITAPQQIDYGSGQLVVTVTTGGNNTPVEGARVGFSKGAEIAAGSFTDANGQSTIRFDQRRVSPGNATITVSGRDIIPATSQIQLNRSARRLVAQSFTILDDNFDPRRGNSNGIANPLEIIEMRVSLLNIGSQSIQDRVNCVLSGGDGVSEILRAEFPIQQQIMPNGIVQASFIIQLGANFPDREPVYYNLMMNSGDFEWESEISLTGRAHRWTIDSVPVGAAPEPGDIPSFDIFLKNEGSFDLGMTHAVLVSDDENVEVLDAEADYDSLDVDQVGSVGEVFTIHIGMQTPRNWPIALHLELSSEEGYTAILPFTILTAQIPTTMITGPDDYGYYAIDNIDWNNGLRMDFNWIEIDPMFGGPGANTGMIDRGEDDDKSVVLDLPFTFQYYGERYAQITVCTNGWAAFGSQAQFVDFRNQPIGAPQGPNAQVCIWWEDLYMPDVNGGVFYYYDAPLHRYIIEWSAMRRWVGPGGPGAQETFEIVLYDPAWHYNLRGDGTIVFQYSDAVHEARVDANGHPFPTIGLGTPDDQGGFQLSYGNIQAPGFQRPAGATAVRLGTDRTHSYGLLKGTLRGSLENEVIQNATIRATHGGWTFSNRDGDFRLRAVLAGIPERVEVTADGYTSRFSDEFVMRAGDSLEFVLVLQRPVFSVDAESFTDSLDAGMQSFHAFTIGNDGDGALVASLKVVERLPAQRLNQFGKPGPFRDEPADFGDRLLSVAASEALGDNRLLGVAFNGAEFLLSGGDDGEGSPKLYRLDERGRPNGQISQPIEDSWGIHDLAWHNGSIYGGCRDRIYRLDGLGQQIESINSPLIPARAIAVDPVTGDIWITDVSRPIYRISPVGEVLSIFSNTLQVYGLAWHPADPDGASLWMFSADGDSRLRISKMNTATGRITPVTELENQEGDIAGGCDITKLWDDHIWAFTAIIQNSGGDRLEVFEIGSNLGWLNVNPNETVIAPNNMTGLQAIVNTDGLEGGDYSADILITHNALGGSFRIPFDLYVVPELAGVHDQTPSVYALQSVYPNPSNGSAIIRFALPVSEEINLSIYDTGGRLIQKLLNSRLNAGTHSVIFEAGDTPSGVYIIRMQTMSGSFTRKFALTK